MGIPSPNYENRNLSVMNNLSRLTPEQQSTDATSSMRRHDDEVATEMVSGVDDRFGGRFGGSLNGINGYADSSGRLFGQT